MRNSDGQRVLDSSADVVPPKRRIFAATVLAILCVLLLIASVVAFGRIEAGSGNPGRIPKWETNAARVGTLDAALIFLSSVVSLGYLSTRPRWAWASAIVLWLLSIGLSSLFAIVFWITDFSIPEPKKTDFSALARGAMFILLVGIPVLVVLISSLALLCLIALRPQRQESESSRQPNG